MTVTSSTWPVNVRAAWPSVMRLIAVFCIYAIAPLALAQRPVVDVTVAADRATVAPGGTVLIAVTFEHSEGFHIHTNSPVVPPELADFVPIPTKIKVTLPATVGVVGSIAWPKPVSITVSLGEKPAPYLVFDSIAVAFVPVTLAANASGTIDIPLKISYQACNEVTCLAPESTSKTVTITVSSEGGVAPLLTNPPFDSYKPAASDNSGDRATSLPPSGASTSTSGSSAAQRLPGQTATPAVESGKLEFPFFGTQFSIDPRGVSGLSLLVLLAIAGGFLLNVMPCVLPVLPLKIVALANAAGTKRRTLILGLAMCAGVILFWLALGAVIALSTGFKSTSQIISMWWFAVGIGVLMIVMGISLLGTFNVQVPKWAYAINPRHDTIYGSAMFGVLTAVLATPCVAPLAATAMGWAAFQPPFITMLIFSAIGVGMAIPYFVLAANPHWVAKVPRAGAGSELMKQTMALFMFAVAAFFIGVGLQTLLVRSPYLGGVLHWWFVTVLVLIACAWMVVRLWQIRAGTASRVVFTLVGIGLGYAGVAFSLYQTRLARAVPTATTGQSHGIWQTYTPELLERSLAEGKVVVVDFTAEWCLNCVAFEIILNQSEVQEALKKPDVVPIIADLTSEVYEDGTPNPAWAYMRSLREVGPPILVIYGPGRTEPFKANSYTKQVVLDQIAASRTR